MKVEPGDTVILKSYKEFFGKSAPKGMGWRQHRFKVDEVFEDCITGYSLEGELKGEYGEPELGMIKECLPT